jgi:methanogenic corrinoid protein MtbC1
MSTQPEPTEALLPIGSVVEQVSRTYPDVTHSSLRFLEREGLIVPIRSSGGHRLYTAKHIQDVLLIKEWQGLRLSLAEIRQRLALRSAREDPHALASSLFDHYLAGNFDQARTIVLAADDAGLSLVSMYGDVLSAVLIEVGARWEQGTLNVSQEREISEAIKDLVAELTARHQPAQHHGPVVVAASIRGELHEIGIRMICGLLGAAGFRVFYLGPNIESRFLLEAYERHRPGAILLSIQNSANLASLQEAISLLLGNTADLPPAVIVGGAAVSGNEALIREWGAQPLSAHNLQQIPSRVLHAIDARTPR